MAAVLSLLTVISLSVLIVRIATVALMLTGLSRPLARFQARSAFTGAGFTTKESEQVTNHPVRRQIISTLILLGNAGIITTVSAVVAGVVAVERSGRDGDGLPIWARVALLLGGLGLLAVLAFSKWVDRRISRLIFKMLKKYTTLDVRDYSNLMHLGGAYGISELGVEAGDWLADHELAELKLSAEGVLVLGIQRADGSFLGTPRGHTTPHAGDTLILYGRADRLKELDRRRDTVGGKIAHVEAVSQHAKTHKDEDPEEPDDDDVAESGKGVSASVLHRDGTVEPIGPRRPGANSAAPAETPRHEARP